MPHSMLHPLTLSIVIPTPGDADALEETLLSVLENRPEGCEVVVALGCDYDDPWGIAEEVRFVRAPVGAGLVECVNAGVAATARPGMGTTAAVGSGAERRVGARRPLWPVVGPRLEAGFWRADLVRDDGPGFSSACGDRLADADMAVELAARGVTTIVEEHSRVVAGVEPARVGGFRAGLHAERLFWRSLAGRALLPALVLHAIEVIRHMVVSAPLATVPMLLGRILASLQVGSYLPRYRQLTGYLAGDEGTADESQATDAGRTIRIDEGREALAGPRRVPQSAEPLRKSA